MQGASCHNDHKTSVSYRWHRRLGLHHRRVGRLLLRAAGLCTRRRRQAPVTRRHEHAHGSDHVPTDRHLLHHPAGLPGQEERGLVVVRRRHAGVAGGQERAARHRDGGRAVRAPPLPRCRAARRYSPPPSSPSRRPSLSLSPAPPPPAPLPAASRKSATTPARERRERREKERMWGLHRPAAASPWLSRPGSGQPPSHTRTSALLQGRRRGKKDRERKNSVQGHFGTYTTLSLSISIENNKIMGGVSSS